MSEAVPDPPWIAGVRDVLLRHYDAHARSLPWRGSSDPYAVWVSEIMLQQTRVDAVVPYYHRWVQRFPDIDTLARADVDDVLKLWEGLGYYSRARNLHSAARIVRERHHGAVPAEYETLRALPGVGEYTAGAVSSIAYGLRRPAVDGNVRRVLFRLRNHPLTAAQLRACAAALVPPDRPGDFNQALMDLGATICTPRAPSCHLCPLAAHCAAFAAGTQADVPPARTRAAVPRFLLATAVITCSDLHGDGHTAPDRVLLVQRPPHGLLARMWCLPAQEVAHEAEAAAGAVSVARALLGDDVACHTTFLGAVDHTFSHRRERYICHHIRCTPNRHLPANAQWSDPDASSLALPRAQRSILSLLSRQPT